MHFGVFTPALWDCWHIWHLQRCSLCPNGPARCHMRSRQPLPGQGQRRQHRHGPTRLPATPGGLWGLSGAGPAPRRPGSEERAGQQLPGFPRRNRLHGGAVPSGRRRGAGVTARLRRRGPGPPQRDGRQPGTLLP